MDFIRRIVATHALVFLSDFFCWASGKFSGCALDTFNRYALIALRIAVLICTRIVALGFLDLEHSRSCSCGPN